MLTDGINLTPSAQMLNSTIEHGTSMPTTNLHDGRVFFLTAQDGEYSEAAYVYTGDMWKTMGLGRSDVVKYDIGMFAVGRIVDPEVILAAYIAPRNMFFEISLPDSVARCKIPPAAITVYNININDVAVGTITFQPGSKEGIITFPYTMMAEPGEIIEIITPHVPDTLISDVGLTMVANVALVVGTLS
jgi:hypothetical protein